MEHLATEVISLGADVALITETHLKKHHASAAFDIQGYNCVRRDRNGRKGGGVAAYLRSDISYSILKPAHDNNLFETLWLTFEFNRSNFILSVIYHPPKPLYSAFDFINFLTVNIDNVFTASPGTVLILAGDMNQLNDDLITNTGLIQLVEKPTRGQSILDKIYQSIPNFS